MRRILLACGLAAHLGWLSPSAEAQFSTLQARIDQFAQDNKMKAFASPERGLTIGTILDAQDQPLQTGCWRLTVSNEAGVDTTHLEGMGSTSGGLQFGLAILKFFGFHIDAAATKNDTLIVSLGKIAIKDASNVSYNWTDRNCLQMAFQPIRVLERLLITNSIDAELWTSDSGHIRLDSANLTAAKYGVTLNANVAAAKSTIVLLRGDSVAVARAVHLWELKRLVCGSAHLPLNTASLKPPTNCPKLAAGDGWYYAQLKNDTGEKVTLSVEAVGVPGATPTDYTVTPGADFILDTLARRVDLGRVDGPRGNRGLTITRLNLERHTQVLGSELPMSRAEASAPVHLSDRSLASQ